MGKNYSRQITVNANIDLYENEIVEQLSDDSILKECNNRDLINPIDIYQIKELYLHGDFDLVKFIKFIGIEDFKEAINVIEK
jgi:hypothetical protein